MNHGGAIVAEVQPGESSSVKIRDRDLGVWYATCVWRNTSEVRVLIRSLSMHESMDTVRPAWLFEVASAFQRCAIVSQEQSIATLLKDVRAALPAADSPLERLILDGLLSKAAAAITVTNDEGTSDALGQRALRLLNEHYAEQLTYREIGREVGCDPEYLEVLFRNRTGESLHAYLRRYRVSKAIEAIQRGEKIEVAAFQVGFRSKSGFNRACRAVTGASPSTWRRSSHARDHAIHIKELATSLKG
jgi:AraC-like DNA-binding protein